MKVESKCSSCGSSSKLTIPKDKVQSPKRMEVQWKCKTCSQINTSQIDPKRESTSAGPGDNSSEGANGVPLNEMQTVVSSKSSSPASSTQVKIIDMGSTSPKSDAKSKKSKFTKGFLCKAAACIFVPLFQVLCIICLVTDDGDGDGLDMDPDD